MGGALDRPYYILLACSDYTNPVGPTNFYYVPSRSQIRRYIDGSVGAYQERRQAGGQTSRRLPDGGPAMSGETNRLLGWPKLVDGKPSLRENWT